MNTFDAGTLLDLICRFQNEAKAAADPTSVTLIIVDPLGTRSEFTGTLVAPGSDFTNPAVGEWHHDHLVSVEGDWEYRWIGAGGLDVEKPGRFRVKFRNVT